MKLHSTGEVEKAAGVSYRTLRRWVRAGLLAQPVLTSDGRNGVHLRWTAAQLRRARQVAKLRAQGLAVSQIAAMLPREGAT
jgi:DNA-binding transcriptional MerR regulator